jgi:hypothetical protein
MTKLIEMLQQLSELDPATCRTQDYSEGPVYSIGDYAFWLNSFNEFEASYKATVIRGRPALAWLRDAVEAAIEARGWYWLINKLMLDTGYRAAVRDFEDVSESADDATAADALLAAFVEAVKAQRQ